jgi:hypothetical protein
MLRALFSTAMESNDARYIANHNFVRSIVIDTKGVPSTRFDLTQDQKNLLYASGVDAARNFLAHWDWDAYKKLFRSGSEPPSRRQLILGGSGESAQDHAGSEPGHPRSAGPPLQS